MTLRGQRNLKTLSYRDQTGKSQEAHQEHWRGFIWTSGRVICAWVGDWGTIQVWARSESEGRRVIQHACIVAGIPWNEPGKGEWIATEAKPGRNGQAKTYGTAVMEGLPVVTKRIGPSGSPYL